MIDCRTFRASNLKPLKGEALVEIVSVLWTRPIFIPKALRKKIDISWQEGIVRRLGQGTFEFGLGDRLVLSPHCGKVITEGKKTFRLVKGKDVIGLFQ